MGQSCVSIAPLTPLLLRDLIIPKCPARMSRSALDKDVVGLDDARVLEGLVSREEVPFELDFVVARHLGLA